MRATIVIISAILGVSIAYKIKDIDNNKEFADVSQQFMKEYEEKIRFEDKGAVTAVLNEFVDKIFANISPFAISNGLDPLPLSDIKENFLIAEIDLTEGRIHGVSTINRYKDVKATYYGNNKTIILDIPIVFSNLSFTYDYDVKIVIVGVSGGLTGVIEDFKINLQLGFDFSNLNASIQQLETTDTGKISVELSGHGITDEIFNILSQFVNDVIHPILTLIIEGIVKTVAFKIVDSVNDIIENILHPNSTLSYV